MLISELKKGAIYIDFTDQKVPLQFTGKTELNVNNGYNNYQHFAYFKPVKTEQNKNWINSFTGITKRFDPDLGNERISKY